MKTSIEINDIALALSSAQASFTGAKKLNKNPFFNATFSDLASVITAISLPFYENNLSFIQAAEYKSGMIAITTRIMHKSGQWVESITKIPTLKQDPQGFGSAISYARRYGLQSLAGLPSVDDDGHYSSAVEQQKEDETAALEININADLIKAAKNMEQLVKIWTLIPKKYHSDLESVKNEKKRGLNNENT